MLIDKYEPKTLDEIALDEKTLTSIINWINSWNRNLPSGEKPALLLTGFPGIGKTTTARCICNSAGWSIMEINASDSRTKETLSQITPSQNNLFDEKNCILFDEADSFGQKKKSITTINSGVIGIDRSGVEYVVDIIKSRTVPIILTANNIFQVPKEIKELCEQQKIYRPSVNALKFYLHKICKLENIVISDEIINAASQCQDYRMGLSMIENRTILSKNKEFLSNEKTVKKLLLNQEVSIEDTKSLLYNLDANCSYLYEPFDLYKTYRLLSRVDLIRTRKQHKQASDLLKTIPKVMLEEFEIVSAAFIDKKKKGKIDAN